jgi:DnaJ-class molecular chaperone
VKIIIEVPQKLSKRQKEILEEFDVESKKNKGLFDRIKDVF